MLLVKDIVSAFAEDVGGGGVTLANEEGRKKAFALYNEITRLLLLDVPVTTTMTLPVREGVVTLDRRIETITMAKACNRAMPVRSRSFRYQDNGPNWDGFCEGSVLQLEDLGDNFPTHQDTNTAMSVMAYSDRVEDDASKLIVEAIEPHHRRTRREYLPITKGIDLAGAPKYLGEDRGLPHLFTQIIALTKPRTAGYVYIWKYDPLSNDLFWLTTMAPDETNSCYRRYRVHGATGLGAIDVKVLLRYVPLYNEDDVSLIQQPDAYKRMARAIASLKGGDDRDYERWRNRAVSLLEKSLQRKEQGQTKQPNISLRNSGSRIRNIPAYARYRHH